MSLTLEWRRRIDNWERTLAALCYVPLGALDRRAHFTFEQLDAKAAASRKFEPVTEGLKWGQKWEYGWFAAELVVPREAEGERLAFRLGTGGECLVFVNGAAVGVDWAWSINEGPPIGHSEVHLTRPLAVGARLELLGESYAGHGTLSMGQGPVPHGTSAVPECPAKQRRVGPASFAIWDEGVYQAWLDFVTLLQLRDGLDPNSLRVAEIDAGLREFTLLVDPELPRAPLAQAVKQGRERLKPLLGCRNGSTAPTMHCFGHAHIDVAWLWPLAETERKCARTFATQLALMDEYPEYKFLQSQPHLYAMTKRLYPELYARILDAARRGQWLAEGGMWVESDTNIPSGESLIRQFTHGKRFFQRELNVDCELLWLPDVFGYSGALPQILRGCGIKYFSTQKIFWNYNGGEQFPYNTFNWRGIDGSEVLAHFHNDYNARTQPKDVIARWNDRVQKDGIDARLFPFGFGDGGGGPTRDHLEFLRRMTDLEGCPKVLIDSPVAFFHAEESRQWDRPTYVGELYFQAHRGTYTSQAKTKRHNRKCEVALHEAELWAAAAFALEGMDPPRAELEEAWTLVLLNQFHDIIPGSSIQRVYEDAATQYESVLAATTRSTNRALEALVAPEPDTLTIFNSLSFARRSLVTLPASFAGALDDEGLPLPTQEYGGETLALTSLLPPCGHATLRRAPRAVRGSSRVEATPTSLENELLRAELDEQGRLVELYDKATNQSWLSGPANELKLYKDVPTFWDAWDLDSTYTSAPVPLTDVASLEACASGPIFAAIRCSRRFSESHLVQEVRLRAGSRLLEFHTRIEWREKHKLLKVCFPLAVRAEDALHEIQFGHVRRPTHASRAYDADRFEVSSHKWSALVEERRGAALLNDCKYGVDVTKSSINLSLLKAATAPDPTADVGIHELTYALYTWNTSFVDSGLLQQAYALNVPALAAPGAAKKRSLFSVNASNVIIETVKPSDDGARTLVVRLYEAARTATSCMLETSLPAKRVWQANMLEEREQLLPYAARSVALSFRPFEIKTLIFEL